MVYKFTKSAEKVMDISKEIATNLGHSYIGTEHILYGLAKEKNSISNKVLEKQNINEKKILEKIEDIIGSNIFLEKYTIGFTPRAKRVIENAFNESKKLNSDYIGTEHLLIGIINESDSIAGRILYELETDISKLYKQLVKILNDIEKEDFINTNNKIKDNISQNLKHFGSDLTRKS